MGLHCALECSFVPSWAREQMPFQLQFCPPQVGRERREANRGGAKEDEIFSIRTVLPSL